MRVALLFLLSLASLGQAGDSEYFVPQHRVSGVGVDRDDLSRDLIDVRTDRMIQSQTFSIMREALSVPGAKRITADSKLQSLFKSAAASSGWPVSTLEAIAYLESWG